jgi:hypothetical protein
MFATAKNRLACPASRAFEGADILTELHLLDFQQPHVEFALLTFRPL